jgi:hypothetical protein
MVSTHAATVVTIMVSTLAATVVTIMVSTHAATAAGSPDCVGVITVRRNVGYRLLADRA